MGGKMKTLSHRDLLKSSLVAQAAVAAQGLGPVGAAIEAAAPLAEPMRAPQSRKAKWMAAARHSKWAPAAIQERSRRPH